MVIHSIIIIFTILYMSSHLFVKIHNEKKKSPLIGLEITKMAAPMKIHHQIANDQNLN